MISVLVAATLFAPLDLALPGRRGRADVAASEAVALTWSAPPHAIASARVRASEDGAAWSEWIAAPLDDDITDPSSGRFATAIVHFGSAKRFVEYAIDGIAENVTMTAFPPPGRRRGRAAADEFRLGTLTIRSRSDWGCPEGQASPRWTPAYTRVTHAVVHHTAGSNTLTDWDAEVRNIWHFHTVTNGWGDIGYNYLIAPDGVIYEGRAGGDGAIGAHFSCRNTNTVGVALLGTYSSVAPAEAALDSLKKLLIELSRRNGIRPNDIVRHVPSGLDVPSIIGHRDGNASPLTCTRTICPGDVLYALLPAIRNEVAATVITPWRRRAASAVR